MQEPIAVEVYGAALPLTFAPGPVWCGGTRDGVSFEFGNSGSWVLPLSELKRLVALAEAARNEPAA